MSRVYRWVDVIKCLCCIFFCGVDARCSWQWGEQLVERANWKWFEDERGEIPPE